MAELTIPTTPEEYKAALKKAKEEGAKLAAEQSRAQVEKLKEKLALATPAKEGGIKVKLADGIYVIKHLGDISIYDRLTKETKVISAEDLAKDTELCQQIVEKGTDLITKLNEK